LVDAFTATGLWLNVYSRHCSGSCCYVLAVVEIRIRNCSLTCNMGLSDDGDEDDTRERFDDLCSDLNMDLDAKTDAWQSYTRIIANYTLEVATC